MRNMVLKVAWQADQHQSLLSRGANKTLYCARTAMEVVMMRFKSYGRSGLYR